MQEEYNYDFNAPPPIQVVAAAVEVHSEPNGVIDITEDGQPPQPPTVEVAMFNQVQEQLIQEPPLFDMDLERMNVELYKDRYLTQ